MGSLSRRCGPSFVWLQLSLALLTVVAACNGHPGRESETLVRVTGAFTVNQSAPIGQRWAKLGGSAVVGNPTSDVQTTPGGAAQYQTFTNGVIVASNDFGAVYITQAIFDKWLSLQGSTTHDGTDLFAYVGVPTADFVTAAGHQDGSFERGRIIVEGSTARVVYGEIYLKYVDFQSVLGLPRSEEASSAAGGRFQLFESGGDPLEGRHRRLQRAPANPRALGRAWRSGRQPGLSQVGHEQRQSRRRLARWPVGPFRERCGLCQRRRRRLGSDR